MEPEEPQEADAPPAETLDVALGDEEDGEELAEDLAEEEAEAAAEAEGGTGFYWKQARENLKTHAGVRAFQLAYKHKDEEYETARREVDREYNLLSPRLQARGGTGRRHGGHLSNSIAFLEELGVMYREHVGDTVYLRATPAGDQAAILLNKLPEALRIIPYFLVDLLARFRFNNPLNRSSRNAELANEIATSDIFPYWTIYKVMRELDGRITKDELARFVFRMKRMAEIPGVINRIRAYRADRTRGMADADIERTYGPALRGGPAQPKYIMGRAGFQVGVIKLTGDVYSLADEYLPFIDEILAHEPAFEELDNESWIREYGDPVGATEIEYLPFDPSASTEPLEAEITDANLVYQDALHLLNVDKVSGLLFIGAPGTGKTWYARQIGIKLVDGDATRLREVQFHPSYQYDDFVEGYVPDSRGGFTLANRHLLQMANLAHQSDKTHVLIINELSRTDPARVMGEALTYMESSLRGQTFYLPSGRQAVIPPNLVFLATMNPDDRSVDEIDAAMDRRWGKIHLPPDPDVVNEFLIRNGMDEVGRRAVIAFFRTVQQHCALGHALFRTVRDRASLERLWRSELELLFKKMFRHDEDTLRDIRDAWEVLLAAYPSDAEPPSAPAPDASA